MSGLDRALLALLAIASATFGLHSLAVAVAIGDSPGLERFGAPLALTLLAAPVLTGAAAILRRTGLGGAVGVAVAWALGVRGVVELPPSATNHVLLDGPHLGPWIAFVATGVGLYVGAARASATTRAAVLCTCAAAANGRLFARDSEAVYALLAASVAWLVVEVARTERRTARGAGRLVIGVGLAFVTWVAIAASVGSFPAQGLQVAARVAVGAALALALAAGLDAEGRTAVLRTLVVLAAVALVSVAIGLFQAASVEGWERVLASRLRLFGMHPNGAGPFFAAGAVVSAGAALAGRGVGRALPLAVAVASALALGATESRASLLGGTVALAALATAVWLRPPRRAWPSVALVGIPALAVLVAWIGPSGPALRAALDARALGPSALGQRYHFWRMALASLRDSPWFGVGPNQYEALARYAEPSYYDGTIQSLHSHNLELGVAAGAGWPALALLLGLFVGLLEALRRALRADVARAARARAGALFAFAAAVLAANQLDLGQSQQTFVPLAAWLALGWLGSASGPRTAPASAGPRLAAWLALPLALPSLLAVALEERAELALERGDPASALALYQRSADVDPANTLALTRGAAVARTSGRPGVELRLRERVIARAPERSGAWLSLARALYERGRFPEAELAVERAAAADPRGERRGSHAILRGGLALARGDVDAGRAALTQSIRDQGSPWTQLDTVALPASSGDPVDSTPLAFTHPGGLLPLAELLDTVGAEAVATAASAPVDSRRELLSVVAGYLAERRPARALAWLERHRAARGGARLLSLDTLELEALLAMGDARGALDFVDGLERVAHATVHRAAAAAAIALGLGQRSERELDAARALVTHEDLFFTAGVYRRLPELELELARARGDWTAAERALERLLREGRLPATRLAAAEAHWVALGQGPIGPDPTSVALRHLLLARSAARRDAPPEARSRRFDALVARAAALSGLDGAELLQAVRGASRSTGWAGIEFLGALERRAGVR